MHAKPGRARQVPPEMDMNLELMLKYWFLLSNLHMVAAGLIFRRLSNFHKVWNASKTFVICCYFEGVVGTVVAAMATEGRRDGVRGSCCCHNGRPVAVTVGVLLPSQWASCCGHNGGGWGAGGQQPASQASFCGHNGRPVAVIMAGGVLLWSQWATCCCHSALPVAVTTGCCCGQIAVVARPGAQPARQQPAAAGRQAGL